MKTFVFDKNIFQNKFIKGNEFRNIAKNTSGDYDSICPSSSNGGNYYKGYTSLKLLTDTIHFLQGEVMTDKKIDDFQEKLSDEIEKQVLFENNELKSVFNDVIASFFFEADTDIDTNSFSLLRFHPESKQKDFGKFIVDVLLDHETKQEFVHSLNKEENPLDHIVSNSYVNLQILKSLKKDKEYTRIYEDELKELFELMNKDVRSVLNCRNNVVGSMEFVLSYYLFVYLSQIALRMDSDLEGKRIGNTKVFFKPAREAVSEDRDCVVQGWKKIERKTGNIFVHLIVLNMLNCHDNKTDYCTYSELYHIYENNDGI